VPFKLPVREGRVWKAVIDTNAPDSEGFETPGGDEAVEVAARSLVVFV
jgi:isoamylase